MRVSYFLTRWQVAGHSPVWGWVRKVQAVCVATRLGLPCGPQRTVHLQIWPSGLKSLCTPGVGSQYGITACTISKCGIKDAAWQSFFTVIHLWSSSHFSHILLCFSFALFLFSIVCWYCTLLLYVSLPSGIFNKCIINIRRWQLRMNQ